jgi:lipoprotein NlpI
VTLEKLSRREDAVTVLKTMKGNFDREVRVYNNLGIIQKRKGDKAAALENYQAALEIDVKSFFPNYNMGVLLS